MQDKGIAINQKIVMKIPQLHRSADDLIENSEHLTTSSKTSKRSFPSIINTLILCETFNSISCILVFFIVSESSSILFYSLIPSLFMIFLQVSVKLYLKSRKVTGTKSALIQLFIYSLTCLTLIFTDLNIVNSFLYRTELALIPSVFYLLILSKQARLIFKNHSRLTTTLNILFGIVSFILNLIGIQRSEATFIQTAYFLVLIPYNSLKKQSNYKIHDIYKLEKEDEDLTPIEIVLRYLSNVLDEFEEMLNCSTCENLAKKSFVLLSSALNTLRNTPNIYSTNIENITRNLNQDDKIFIEQSFSDKSIYSCMNDSDDVKENMNMVYGITDLVGVLKQIGVEWNFNTFFVSDCSGNKPLQVCGEYIFRKYNFDKVYKIPEETFLAFFNKLEEAYIPNPYHNSCHAADMMCSYLYLLNVSNFIKKMNSLELFACVIACLAHDVGHKGKSNRFLILSKDPASLRYNDFSVQEMMHCFILFDILSYAEYNILSHLHTDNWFLIRKVIIEMVLSTDMQKHFEVLGVAKAKYTNSLQAIDFNDSEVKMDIFKLTVKCADLGHAAKDTETHHKWCGLLIQEFFEQGDMEKELGMPVSMYCDRESTDISKSQAGFIQSIVLPTYMALSSVVRTSELDSNCIAQIKRNKSFWSTRRSLSKNQTVLMKKQQEYKQKEYLELMEKAGGLKRSITPYVVTISDKS